MRTEAALQDSSKGACDHALIANGASPKLLGHSNLKNNPGKVVVPVNAESNLFNVETATRSGYYYKAAPANGPGSALDTKARYLLEVTCQGQELRKQSGQWPESFQGNSPPRPGQRSRE